MSVYLWANIALGTGILLWSQFNWRCDDPFRFASFSCRGRDRFSPEDSVAGSDGTSSVSVLVISVGIADLSLPEALAIRALSMLAQCTWRTKARPRVIQVSLACARWRLRLRFGTGLRLRSHAHLRDRRPGRDRTGVFRYKFVPGGRDHFADRRQAGCLGCGRAIDGRWPTTALELLWHG